MKKDFNLYSDNGKIKMSLDDGDSLKNNLALSLMIPQGSWWYDPEFGIKWTTADKMRPDAPEIYEQRAMAALQWILDLKRASSITVAAKRLSKGILNVTVEAVAPADRVITYTTFAEVL